jgi:hypothetical protein
LSTAFFAVAVQVPLPQATLAVAPKDIMRSARALVAKVSKATTNAAAENFEKLIVKVSPLVAAKLID